MKLVQHYVKITLTIKFSECECSLTGTIEGTICNKKTAECECREGYTGTNCDTCKDGFFMNSKTRLCEGNFTSF